MNLSIILMFTACLAAVSSEPILFISNQNHSPVFGSEQLLKELEERSNVKIIELAQELKDDLNKLRQVIANLGISKEKVSSFFTSSEKLQSLKEQLNTRNIESEVVNMDQIQEKIKSHEGDLVIHLKASPSAARILQETAPIQPVDSKLFNNLSTYGLSGLWVTLFLLVMMGIGLSCSFDLKTNDRFARQNLWIGRQS